jgi:hypothetical protein
MASIGKILMLVGGGIFVAGVIISLFFRARMPFGQLPGDIQLRYGNLACVFPLAASLLISIILTILFNILLRSLNR